MTVTFSRLLDKKIKRRDFLKKLSIASASTIAGAKVLSATSSLASNATIITEVPHAVSDQHQVSDDYNADLVIHWGQQIIGDTSSFDYKTLTKRKQEKRFGYNNDYIAYMPLEKGSDNSQHGLLCVNHETVTPALMFDEYDEDNTSEKQVNIQMAAVGHSVVEVKYEQDKWQVINGKYNRRITAFTECRVAGPAAGHERLQTLEDPAGLLVIGTFGNCAGGTTPWGTVLTAEENIDVAFTGDISDTKEAQNHKSMGIGQNPRMPWHNFHERFDVENEPNEPNRFGWICEYDPYDPDSIVSKRTALGRFKHEGAQTLKNYDNKIVIYMGDDEKFQHIYKFVSKEKYSSTSINSHLLDTGTLYVAKFYEENSRIEWLPLVHGSGPLTEENGFNDQGDVLIEARQAAKLLGATPMDRPEGIAYNSIKNSMYVALTSNTERDEDTLNVVNPRPNNKHGHIITLVPDDGDHAATSATWDILLLAGDPNNPNDNTQYPEPPSQHGWFSTPDNLLCGIDGKLWITTDGQEKTINANDGLYVMETKYETPKAPRHIFNAPKGAEVTGPALTPNHRTLFISIQHPGEKSSINSPSTHWPHNDKNLPPYPGILALTKKDGGFV